MSLSLFKCKMKRLIKTQRPNPKRQKLRKNLRLRSTSKKDALAIPVVASVAKHVARTTSAEPNAASAGAPGALSGAIVVVSRWCTRPGQRRPKVTTRPKLQTTLRSAPK